MSDQNAPLSFQSALSDDFAIGRLCELAMSGDSENVEFSRLDEMIYQRLMQSYGGPTQSEQREYRIQTAASIDDMAA